MDGWKTILLLGWPIFRGYVSFRDCFSQNGVCFCMCFFARCTFAHPVLSACLFSPNECHLFCFQKSSSHCLSSESSMNAVVLIESRLIVFFLAPGKSWFKIEEDWYSKHAKLFELLLQSYFASAWYRPKKDVSTMTPLKQRFHCWGHPCRRLDIQLKECQRLFQRIGAMNDENAVLKVRVWKPGSSIERIFLWDETTWNDLERLRWCLFPDP